MHHESLKVPVVALKEDTHLTLMMTKQRQIGLEVTGVVVTGVVVNSSGQVAGQVCTVLLWHEAL